MSKVCTKCDTLKPLCDFYKKPSGKPIAQCKTCHKNQNNDFYAVNKKTVLNKKKQYFQANKDIISKRMSRYKSERSKVDVNYKISNNLRSRLNKALKSDSKTGSSIANLGCSIIELKAHLESQFQLGMTWDNYGKWHIDHIKPLSQFNLNDKSQLLLACHYTNLQPLWAIDNIRKGSL